MNLEIKGKPSFAYLNVELAPGESIVAESDAMSSMASGISLATEFNGGVLGGLVRKYLGNESMFVNTFTNTSQTPRNITLVQATPGDIQSFTLRGNSLCLQPGSFVCATPGVKLGVRWAGFVSWIAREGLFRLEVSGDGTVWYGAYGGMVEKEINGEYIVDTAHLVAYEPQLSMKLQLVAGLFASIFSGEGFVTRLKGRGKIVMQTRSLDGLKNWLNTKLH